MDFNRSISSFKEQFKALQNLCNLALDANIIRPNIKPRILFTSSIGIVGQYNLIHGGSEVPEVRIDDAACTNEFGYGQAKLVCERILENISGQYPHQIEAGYVRVGQSPDQRPRDSGTAASISRLLSSPLNSWASYPQ